MSIKKQFEELYTFLKENENKKVSSILPTVLEMCESKQLSTTHVKTKDGDIVAVFCYYHKEWEDVSICEYGKKASSTTGLNTMCKLGVKAWTKQQKLFKQLDSDLLTQAMNEEIDLSDVKNIKEQRLQEIKEEIAEEFKRDANEFTTLEELKEKYDLED